MAESDYIMESSDEALRLDLKTDGAVVERQADWAGICKGMRVADLGCGSGKTTFHLHQLVRPDGETIGVDYSDQRIAYAESHYQDKGLTFCRADIRHPITDLGEFDFIWIRFVLEYYRKESPDILRRVIQALKPGGILCLVDLDFNCLIHYGLSPRLERTISRVINAIEQDFNFDPLVGRKLYAYMYDLGFDDIRVDLQAHNLIYGTPGETDLFNWQRKMDLAKAVPDGFFDEFDGGRDEFLDELNAYVIDPRRFTYTPVVSCRGIKPRS